MWNQRAVLFIKMTDLGGIVLAVITVNVVKVSSELNHVLHGLSENQTNVSVESCSRTCWNAHMHSMKLR